MAISVSRTGTATTVLFCSVPFGMKNSSELLRLNHHSPGASSSSKMFSM